MKEYGIDYFISYAHEDDKKNNGLISKFAKKLREQKIIGENGENRPIKIFFDTENIEEMDQWRSQIFCNLRDSRFIITFVSPNYFKREFCAKEFQWWIDHETERGLVGKTVSSIFLVDLTTLQQNPQDFDSFIEKKIRARYPNWAKIIREYQNFKIIKEALALAHLDATLIRLRNLTAPKIRRMQLSAKVQRGEFYPEYNTHFVGRRDELIKMSDYLNSQSQTTVTAINGLGGIGKSELAITYGYSFAWNYQLGLFFARCEDKKSIYDVIESCGIEKIYSNIKVSNYRNDKNFIRLFEDVKKAKGGQKANLYLILDNINTKELFDDLEGKFPEFVHIVMTTRSDTNVFYYLVEAQNDNLITLDKLSNEESRELLSAFKPIDLTKENAAEEDAYMEKIVVALQGYTLALQLVGHYLKMRDSRTYKSFWRRIGEDFDNIDKKYIRLDQRYTELSLKTILDKTCEDFTDLEWNYLSFAALLPPDAIPTPWMYEFLHPDGSLDEQEDDDFVEPIEDAHDKFVGLGLLQKQSDDKLARMHRLVGKYIRTEKGTIEDLNKKEQTIWNKVAERLSFNSHEYWSQAKNSWELDCVAGMYQKWSDEWILEDTKEELKRNRSYTHTLDMLAAIYTTLDDFNKANTLHSKVLNIIEQRYEKFANDIDTLRDLIFANIRLGYLNYFRGGEEQAYFNTALGYAKRLLDQFPDSLIAQNDLDFCQRLVDMNFTLTEPFNTNFDFAALEEKSKTTDNILTKYELVYCYLQNATKALKQNEKQTAQQQTELAKTIYDKLQNAPELPFEEFVSRLNAMTDDIVTAQEEQELFTTLNSLYTDVTKILTLQNALKQHYTTEFTNRQKLQELKLWLIDSSVKYYSDWELVNIKEIKFGRACTDMALCCLSPLRQMKNLNLYYCDQLTNESFKHLSKLIQLEEVNTKFCEISNVALQYLSNLINLKLLNFCCCFNITDEGIEYLSKLKELQSLNIGYCKITDKSLEEIAINFKHLKYLNLEHCNITTVGINSLIVLENLQDIDCEHHDFEDKDIIVFSKFRNLKTLNLSHCKRITDAGINVLKKANPHLCIYGKFKSSIHILDCNSTNITLRNVTDNDLKALLNFSNLTTLELVDCEQITDIGLQYISQILSLQYLKINRTYKDYTTSNGLKCLSKLTQLKELDIEYGNNVTEKVISELRILLPNTIVNGMSFEQYDIDWESDSIRGSDFDDNALILLKAHKKLKHLDLSYNRLFTDKGLQCLKYQPNLQNLNLEYCSQITDNGIKYLSEVKNLQNLNLKYCKGIEGHSFKELYNLKKLCLLELDYCDNLSNQGYENLSNLTQLQSLSLLNCKVTDIDFLHLSKLQNLININLKFCKITEFGFECLSKLTKLEELYLQGQEITNAGLEHISKLTQLKTLDLMRCQFDDKALFHLSKLTKLEELDLWWCNNITLEGVIQTVKPLKKLHKLHIGICNTQNASTRELLISLLPPDCEIKW